VPLAIAAFSCALVAALGARAAPGDRVADLPVPGFRDAVVVVPSRTPAPLLVAAHGAWDQAEPHCDLWRSIVRGRAFVVCPRGRPTTAESTTNDAPFYYPSEHELAREVLAAVDAMRARFGNRIDATFPLYAGFSQGAIQGAVMLPSSDVHFARAALVEGGFAWSAPSVRRFVENGGERVLFVCGTPSCDVSANAAARRLDAHDIDTRVELASGAGHTYGGAVADILRASFDWLIDGDARFR
jgi:hypothetical protein